MPLKRSPWRPILAGELRDCALKAIQEIAAELKGRAWKAMGVHPSLAFGASGLAILYAYLDQALPGNGNEEVALRFLNHAVSAIEAEPMGPALHSGISGVGWAVAHIEGCPSDAEEDNPFEAD